MAQKEATFTATVNTEGQSNTIRGKIPSGLIQMLGAGAGDVIEFKVEGRHIVDSRVLKGRAAEVAKANAHGQSKRAGVSTQAKPKATPAQAPKPKPQVKAAPVVKKPAKPTAQAKPQVKGRKTQVAYEKPVMKKPVLKKRK